LRLSRLKNLPASVQYRRAGHLNVERAPL